MSKETVITANDLPADVVSAIKGGNKIEAIKLLRLATGIGLANAKVLVDAGARLHGIKHQHTSMTDPNTAAAGLMTLALLLVLTFCVYYYFLN
jgi:ribosomal protein L7/L12